MILTAVSKANGLITLTRQHKRRELEEWRRSDNFFCPQCKGKLILKVGQVVIPHFAHISSNDCSSAFSEGESADHLAGKQQLYEFFQSYYPVQLEAVLDKIKQRPDLLVNNRFAIEYQCSPIPKDLFDHRNAGYKEIGIKPIWIIRTPTTLQELSDGIQLFSLSKFQQLFIPRRPLIGQTLLTYDNTNKSFLYASHLLPVQQNQVIAKIRRLPIGSQQFPFLLVNPPTKRELKIYEKIYSSKRRRFLSSRVLTSRKGLKDRFLRNCYMFRIRPEELPSFIGMPTAGSEIFEGHAVEWQANLIFHVIENGMEDQSLDTFINRQPHLDRNLAWAAVNNFLLFLDQLGLCPLTPDCLRKSVPVEILFELITPHFLAKRYEN
ncbi:competence protein CoiA [Chungangia koreensis]|uniref:Competence protein CoiA n=1 Tax=Chungangia koreensis TaxID=752657 RepID=A0ABV8X5Z1_9LACT